MATGQIGAEPAVHVWDALSRETLSVIQGFHVKGVCAVSFSCSGKLLVSVGIDDAHSVAVWKWVEGAKHGILLNIETGSVGYVHPVDSVTSIQLLLTLHRA